MRLILMHIRVNQNIKKVMSEAETKLESEA